MCVCVCVYACWARIFQRAFCINVPILNNCVCAFVLVYVYVCWCVCVCDHSCVTCLIHRCCARISARTVCSHRDLFICLTHSYMLHDSFTGAGPVFQRALCANASGVLRPLRPSSGSNSACESRGSGFVRELQDRAMFVRNSYVRERKLC